MIRWPFKDSQDTVAFTSKRILDGADWVYYVTHDVDDGVWQFHPYSGPTPEQDAAIVSLKTMLTMDPSISVLGDLPPGWHAWREAPDSHWVRKPMN